MSQYYDTLKYQKDGERGQLSVCYEDDTDARKQPVTLSDYVYEDGVTMDGKYDVRRGNDTCGKQPSVVHRKLLVDLSRNYCHETMLCGYDRMATFKDWPEQMVQKGRQLAWRGFYYTGVSDKVACAWCGLRLWKWCAEDDIDFEHHRFSPSCSFLKITCPFKFDSDTRTYL
ncbi:E3 ubiquitin-protein ligase XIAP-like [Haliotis rubra]|uniref:E3 ubiquitin-protein ligase XIAP-like n=1 Tax=Haliotis rubra TaxID=36100 RepID=UPI001EE5345B|nr:E3 ubiquitin-protein ligase XIAP-like [Haliotis rubra]